ncbi:MAG: hypothetical protein AAGF67_13465, partial [Verrucomicrobiota bacterium]
MRGKSAPRLRSGAAILACVLGWPLLFSQTGCQSTSDEPMSIGAQAPTGAQGNRSDSNPLAVNFGGRSSLPQGPPPNITARAAILVDSSGRVLYEKNADTRMPVASTQKLLLGIM